MKKILLRSLLALAVLAFVVVSISCAHKRGAGKGGGVVVQGGPSTPEYGDIDPKDHRATYVRMLSSTVKPEDLQAFKAALGNNPSLYKIHVYQNGSTHGAPALGTLPSTTPQDPLPPSVVQQADSNAALPPKLNGVAIQGGRGRGGGAATLINREADKDLVDRVRQFFLTHP